MSAIQPQPSGRLQDPARVPSGPAQLSVSQLVKIWRHTDPKPEGIREARITGTSDALSFQCEGAGGFVPASYPMTRVSAIFAANPASRDGMAFFAEVDYGHLVSRYQGNVNLGLLVLAGFHDFRNAENSNYFSREFFYSVASTAPKPPPPVLNQAGGSRQLEISPLLGFWRNTNANSPGISGIKISPRDESVAVQMTGVGESGSVDWGEVQGNVYANDPFSFGAMAFSATFDKGATSCHLQANIKQGVLVVAYFTEFRDGSGRSNYFLREFYYKEPL
jgi:hypothetical protein